MRTLHPDWKWNIYAQVDQWTPKENSILKFNDELEADFNDVDDKIFHFKGRALHGRKLEEKDKKILYRINWHRFSLSLPDGKQIELTAYYDDEKPDGTTYYKIIKSLVLFGSADGMTALARDDQQMN